eukprot:6558172-Pyramimonas_sp.AAC.1
MPTGQVARSARVRRDPGCRNARARPKAERHAGEHVLRVKKKKASPLRGSTRRVACIAEGLKLPEIVFRNCPEKCPENRPETVSRKTPEPRKP